MWDEIIHLNATPQNSDKDNSIYSLVRLGLQNLGVIYCATLQTCTKSTAQISTFIPFWHQQLLNYRARIITIKKGVYEKQWVSINFPYY